jgi:hypothetical protein
VAAEVQVSGIGILTVPARPSRAKLIQKLANLFGGQRIR